MEQLRCQSPDMAEKELMAYLVAHNLIRCLIAEAIAAYQVDLEDRGRQLHHPKKVIHHAELLKSLSGE